MRNTVDQGQSLEHPSWLHVCMRPMPTPLPSASASRSVSLRHKTCSTWSSLADRPSLDVFQDEEGDEYKGSKFGGFPEYFRRKKIKLQNRDVDLRSLSGKPPIFRGVVAHVNGYTQPSLNDVHDLIVSHGGGFMQYLDGKTTVTHIIAGSLTPKKRVEFRRYRIVKPAWVVESINAGKLLPWDDFRVVDEGVGQKVLAFDQGRVISEANEVQRGYRDQSDTSWYARQVQEVAKGLGRGVEATSFPSTQPPLAADERPASQSLQSQSQASGFDSISSEDLRALETVEAEIQSEAPGREAKHVTSPPDAFGPPIEDAMMDSELLVTDLMQLAAVDHHLPGHRDTRETTVDEDVPLEESDAAVEPDASSPALKRTDSSNTPSPMKRSTMTAEEHNTSLLADPRVRKFSVLNPDFLRQYYSESRLHHLSAWKADLKARLQQLTAEKSSSQKLRQKRVPGARRYILHVDFDSFFAAVSLKNAPQLKEKAVVVAHGSGSGSEIASCNYVARQFGIKNGMWMKRAHSLCPDLHVLPYDFKAYEEASRHFYDAILATGGIVQSVSVDEALVDVSMLCLPAGGSEGRGVREGSIWREQAKADEIAQTIRDVVMEKTSCAVSVGIGGNILLAKVALRKAKPAGRYQIKPEAVLDFVGDLTVQHLPGVAHSIGGKLEEIGVKHVKDVRNLSKERIITALGPKTGEKIWAYSRGIDRTEVGEQVIRKSVSAEVNWGVRFETQAQADDFVNSLCGELHRRLVEQKVKGRQMTMKIMRRAADAPLDPPKHLGHGKCDVYNKSVVLGVSTTSQDVLAREALSILRGFGFSPGELRGLGVQVTKLEPLRGSADGQLESSQKRLHFKNPVLPQTPRKDETDPIEDDLKSPAKAEGSRMLPGLGTARAGPDDQSQKPLNTLGTQFVLPTQVDPDVLAELPEEIRSKLLQSRNVGTPSRARQPESTSPQPESPGPALDGLPSQSQLDPDTLDALPASVKQEVLAFYNKSSGKPHGQSLLPQSPRKNRTLTSSSKKVTTPTKKRTGTLFRGRGKGGINSTLTQSNFVAKALNAAHESADGLSDASKGNESDNEEISPGFLEALPADIRREVLAQHKRDRLKRKGNLSVSTVSSAAGRKSLVNAQAPEPGQRLLRLGQKKPKPTFTTKRLSTLPELRETISAWVQEFSDEAPYQEDVQALASYLVKVTMDERDLDKAVAVVKWLDWLVEDTVRSKGRAGWIRALNKVKNEVQGAVISRGLGMVEF